MFRDFSEIADGNIDGCDEIDLDRFVFRRGVTRQLMSGRVFLSSVRRAKGRLQRVEGSETAEMAGELRALIERYGL